MYVESLINRNLTLHTTIIFVACLMLMVSTAVAELKIDSVYPTLGKVSEDLEVTISGEGFDQNTRISMSLDTTNSAAIISSVGTTGYAFDVLVSGSIAYVADGSSGLQIINIANSRAPTIIGSVNTPGHVKDVTIFGSTAFVADGIGLKIIDIANPRAPAIIGSVDTPGYACSVSIAGSLAYVADDYEGLQIIDITNPTAPSIIGSVDIIGWPENVTVIGSTAYVADGVGLKIIDITNPIAPTIIGSVDTPGSASCVTIAESTAYVADTYSGLQIIDITNPTAPYIFGSIDTPDYASGVTIAGSYLYVADWEYGLQVIDITNPTVPTIIGSVDTPSLAMNVTISGSTAYVADGESGMQIIDIANITAPAIIGSVDTLNSARSVSIAGSIAYVADGESGMQIIDITNPTVPIIIGSVDTPSDAYEVTIEKSTAYVAEWESGMQIIDITNPTVPTIIGAIDTPDHVWGVNIAETTAYLALGDSGLLILDIANPTTPTIIGSVDTPGCAWNLTTIDSTAYVADDNSGLQILDITNPRAPTVIGSIDTPGRAKDITVVDTIAYVADGDSGMQIINIANPTTPTIIGSVDTPGHAFDITIDGTTAYVLDGDNGLLIIDVTNPRAPTIIGSIDTPGYASDVAISGSIAFMANGNTGLVIVPLPVELSSFVINSDTSMICTLPSPNIEGSINLRVLNTSESDDILGAVTFLTSEDFEPKNKMKAIIVAGGGDIDNNSLWECTQEVSNQAYISLILQGYTKENVYYLGEHSVDLYPNDDIVNDVDARATMANLSWAINIWASDASELLLFMTDHGKNGTFTLNSGEKYFSAKTLDGWLDNLQTSMPGRVVCVYDACLSGSFIPLLTPVAGKERIVIVSSKADEEAWFEKKGILSFSFQFWSSVMLRGKLYDSFLDASAMMSLQQTALLDADGDGVANTKDDQIAAYEIEIGRGRIAGPLPPEILAVSSDHTLNGNTEASLGCKLNTESLDYIDTVWALIVPPDHSATASDIPVTDLASVNLVDADGDGTFEGDYNGFNQNGTYQVIVYAKDKDDIYSLPASFYVHQQAGATSAVDGGYALTKDMWAKAVLEVPGAPVPLVWKLVGADITPSGDQVISGYFYADPDDFAYGSVYNPEVFVKVYITTNGWCNIAFNHVTVDPVNVYSAHQYSGSSTHTGSATLSSRLVEHIYTGISIDNTLQSSGDSPEASGSTGYTVSSGLWARAWLSTVTGPVNLIWKAVGTDTTPSGDIVVSGYFYASPVDFAYGSLYNPEVFVKVYIAANGWANMTFNHVTVDGVEIMSALNFSGLADQFGTATLEGRLVEHQYNSVGLQ